MPGVDFRKSSVVARLSTKCFTDPSGSAKRFAGNSGSGAWALLVRSGTIANTASSVFFTSRPGSPAGADMTFSLASVRRKSSAAAMCSITCATDQRSAAGLKFHCASDSPFVASRTFFFVVSRYCSALSFSACVTSCADTAAAPAIKSNAISTPTLVLIFSLLVICDRGAADFLICDWRNGDLQHTTSSALSCAPAGWWFSLSTSPWVLGTNTPVNTEIETGSIGRKFSPRKYNRNANNDNSAAPPARHTTIMPGCRASGGGQLVSGLLQV